MSDPVITYYILRTVNWHFGFHAIFVTSGISTPIRFGLKARKRGTDRPRDGPARNAMRPLTERSH